ncbi:MAG: gamma-glutamyl-gamma-aminobutyrate hydrolase family protein [Peptococcaceae bacterium]|jgi:putative glutamine amidotransferase|nr:gamma-glutamyl-gamma-aminobutyrate hydrolase family protein [Peptococcaceae bacterium]MDH7523893.1 gamma-glutamyl-gamma-aminobutyrate hydrolase family protein [Peptococcaceae bacterium]
MPLIGVTCHADTGGEEDIFPGRALHYIDRTYSDILINNGMLPFLIPVNENEEYITRLLQEIDGLLCTGGGRIPARILNQKEIPGLSETAPDRYRFEKRLFEKVLELDLPVLGMCRGMQMMNEVMGGSLYLKISENIPGSLEHNQVKLGIGLEEPYHDLTVEKESHLARIFGKTELRVNSWHSQAVKELGQGFRAVGRSRDQVIEAIESEVNSFVLLTQFHPEILVKKDETWNKLFQAFKLRAAQARKRKEMEK